MKLNLGCWHRYIPGFIHVDLCDFEHIDHKSVLMISQCLKILQYPLIYSSIRLNILIDPKLKCT